MQHYSVLLQMDFSNMFNSVSRAKARNALLQIFPDLVWLLDQLYPKQVRSEKFYYRCGGGQARDRMLRIDTIVLQWSNGKETEVRLGRLRDNNRDRGLQGRSYHGNYIP